MLTMNSRPYFDDYNPEKNYYQILFKPGMAVQARELTQLQTLLQSQIERFGQHVFKDGSIVLGGKFNLETDVPYIKIQEDFTLEDLESFVGTEIRNDGGITAVVYAVAHKSVWSSISNNILLIRYTSGQPGTGSGVFDSNQKLYSVSGYVNTTVSKKLFTTTSSSPSGMGSVFSIEAGVVFSRGYFISFLSQRMVVDPISTTPTCKIGFDSSPSIVTANEDETLLDNAQGSYNYAAPGADRLQVVPLLVKTGIEDSTTLPKFIALMIINNGIILEEYSDSQYARLGGEFARRTYEESGDYVINGLDVDVREWYDSGTNGGLYSNAGQDGTNYLSAEVSPGLAYVKGLRIAELVTKHVKFPKSQTYLKKSGEVLSSIYGNYITVKNVVGTLDESTIDQVYLLTGAELAAYPADLSNSIGTARVIFFSRTSDPAEFRVYLSEIVITASGKTFNDVVAVLYKPSGINTFRANLVNHGLLENTSVNQSLLFPIGVGSIKTTKPITGTNTSIAKTIYEVKRNVPASNISSLTMTISINHPNEIIKGTTTRNGDSVQDYSTNFIVTNTDTGAIASISGVVTSGTNQNSVTITGSSAFSGNYLVSFVTEKTITNNDRVKTLQSNKMVRLLVGDPPTDSLSLGLADVFAIKSIKKYNGSGTNLDRNLNNYTDVTSAFSFNNGQTDTSYNHAFITPIVGKITLAHNDILVVTLDYFAHSGSDYFSVDSYSINLENIPVYVSSNTGKVYDLRNTLDFRYIKTNTATPVVPDSNNLLPAGAWTNPAPASTTLASQCVPSPTSNIELDYSYYLARRDVLGINTLGDVVVVLGDPAVAPISPKIPSDVMGLANIYVPPYPSLATTYAKIIGKQSQGVLTSKIASAGYTMRDIGVLKQRIETLEYYNALTLLEKSAADLKIMNSSGNDRFKNGFFVDGFLDHSLGATDNPDYRIVVDKVEQSIRPAFVQQSFDLTHDLTTIDNVQKTGDLITLKYDSTSPEITFVEQSRVSTTRNIEQSVFRYVGKASIYPEEDTWPTTQLPSVTIGDTSGSTVLSSNTVWGAWQSDVTGYNLYDRRYGDRSSTINPDTSGPPLIAYKGAYYAGSYLGTGNPLEGSFGSLKDAMAAYSKDSDTRAKLETVTTSTRSGLNTTVTSETKTEEFGNLLRDVSVSQYVRPQVIRVFCRGLKAYTKFFVFFDSEDMTNYTTPGYSTTDDPSDIVPGLNSDGTPKTEGLVADTSQLISDEYGELKFLLRLPPEKPFKAGTKEIMVTDSPTNSVVDAVSWSKSYFVSNALIKTYQDLTVSTRTAVVKNETVSETRKVAQKVEILGPSCMAYSFLVNEAVTVPGIFLTSVDVWIAAKHPSLGVWFEIREMDSGGGITRTQVPMSEVWYKGSNLDEIIVSPTMSADAAPHNVKFRSPVYLKNNTQYAFVIHTEGLNPNYYFWISRLGETDLITNNQITGRQRTGTVFTTNNNLNWDPVPDIDLKVRFNRANFSTTPAVVNLVEGNYDFFRVTTPTLDTPFKVGEQVFSRSCTIVASLTGSGSVAANQVIKAVLGSDTVTIGTITSASFNSPVWTLSVTLEKNSAVPLLIKSSTPTSIALYSDNIVGYVGAIVSSSFGSGDLMEYSVDYDADGNRINTLTLKNSNGLFAQDDELFSAISGKSMTLSTISDWDYSTINFKPNHLLPAGTSCSYKFKNGALSSGSVSLSEYDASPDSSFTFNDQFTIKSASSGSVSKSFNIECSLESSSSHVSPVIDLGRVNSIFVRNIINNNSDNETEPSGGKALNKYISKTVTLADGQDAEDLLVTLTSYLPIGTDVKVYMKIRNDADPTLFSMRPWVEMTRNKTGVNSSSVNKNDFIEFEYGVPSASKNPVVYYGNYVGFKQFAIKIVLLATESSNSPNSSSVVPRVADLRAIALQL